ncbi:LysR family transcriptional regulator [Paenibacillus filicis]|uniref:LysR family transcriptional regulator n=1 Tax=Paenibacillus filicis TaxID=669464 RepID=A0ABU9DG39_9BACL
MELTDLKVFITIAEEGSVSRAAERLGYVQSNVTARVRKLEDELGVSLFHRHPKGMSLTEKGSSFQEYASAILHMSEEAVKSVRETPYPSGPLSIGVVETVHCGNFLNALSDYQAKYPEVSLSLGTGSSSELQSKVLNYELDGAFVTGEIISPKLVSAYSEQDELRLLTKQPDTDYPDIRQMKWAVSPKGCPFRKVLETWLQSEGIPLMNMIEIGSLETLLGCVRTGLASTLLPTSVLYGTYEQLGIFPIPEKFRFTQTSLIRRDGRFSSKAFTAFVEMVKANGM